VRILERETTSRNPKIMSSKEFSLVCPLVAARKASSWSSTRMTFRPCEETSESAASSSFWTSESLGDPRIRLPVCGCSLDATKRPVSPSTKTNRPLFESTSRSMPYWQCCISPNSMDMQGEDSEKTYQPRRAISPK
jgi:hypothetical protein